MNQLIKINDFNNDSKPTKIEKLNIPKLINLASLLTGNGKLAISANKLVYLKIDDAFIHQLFSLLENRHIKKPDYFGENSAGAHITAIYPEEYKLIDENDLGQEHSFLIKDIVSAELDVKTYYALLVEAPSLLTLRKKYNLPELLCFKNYLIGFHITIGVKI